MGARPGSPGGRNDEGSSQAECGEDCDGAGDSRRGGVRTLEAARPGARAGQGRQVRAGQPCRPETVADVSRLRRVAGASGVHGRLRPRGRLHRGASQRMGRQAARRQWHLLSDRETKGLQGHSQLDRFHHRQRRDEDVQTRRSRDVRLQLGGQADAELQRRGIRRLWAAGRLPGPRRQGQARDLDAEPRSGDALAVEVEVEVEVAAAAVAAPARSPRSRRRRRLDSRLRRRRRARPSRP